MMQRRSSNFPELQAQSVDKSLQQNGRTEGQKACHWLPNISYPRTSKDSLLNRDEGTEPVATRMC